MGQGKGARARQQAKRKAWLENRPYAGFSCTKCGHPDYIHYMWVGPCIHNESKPLDGSTCDCQSMDGIDLNKKGEDK